MRRRGWPAASSSRSSAPTPTSSACRCTKPRRCCPARAIRSTLVGSTPCDGRRAVAVAPSRNANGERLNLATWLERAGKEDPQRPALGRGTRVLRSYGELAERVARIAGALKAMGLAPGDRVAIAAVNSPDYLELIYADWHGGLAAVLGYWKMHGSIMF